MKALVALLVLGLATSSYAQTTAPAIIKLNEFAVVFPGVAFYTDMHGLTDTEIMLEETIEGALIEIEGDDLDEIQVEQKLETSLTILNEGAHCDLRKWLHYTSEWRQLKETAKGKFRGLVYTDADKMRFPAVSMNKLLDAVNDACGERWVLLAKTCKSVNEGLCVVTASGYFLRIKAKQKATGKKIEKVVSVLLPMGC